ncbi:5-oxoprolinase subunit C family protein [Aureispira anguillae]|uniref:Biotin-dependent carboxyltransferase family protein n=1 Tax=Aureispira anguillae TaxID=2864201 RepID=A0A915VK45_9BACT|nr:biotin-dependent carboxyltransferase family protein [Aureispira anguillae]BDS09395.1 biotin-dependent carboxyltransferase family protein [Aureispira anguillae]
MSKTSILHFQQAGLQTTVQDKGRLGYQQFGIPIGGAMDQSSADIANWLVGNPTDAPLLEITLLGPTIRISKSCQIALTGAHISPLLNGQALPMYQTIPVPKNSILSFGPILSGCRAYLAVGGTWSINKWLSSYSPILHNGQALPSNSILKKDSQFMIYTKKISPLRNYPKEKRPIYPSKITVRVTIGPEFEQFSRTAIAAFFGTAHSISNHSNRMGYRLSTRLFNFTSSQELISSGIVPGTVQISNAGQPIILLKDAPTTGGYPRIANIYSEDLDAVAQLKPNDKICFSLII